MPDSPLEIHQCSNPGCSFRFPAPAAGVSGHHCPKCGWQAEIVRFPHPTAGLKKREFQSNGPLVDALLDNIRSTFNVGSIFRASDGAGLHHLHLCGITPTPENSKVAKTALGAELSVPWTYHLNAVHAARELKALGYYVCALEAVPGSCSIFEAPTNSISSPVLLIVGNEVTGVDPDLLELSDIVLSIPMQGKKESLNVSLAFGIAAYTLRFGPFVIFP